MSWCLWHGAGGKGPHLPVFASRGTNEKTLLLSLHGGHRALSTVAQAHRNMDGCLLSQEASPESERGTGYAFADRPQIACENAFVSCLTTMDRGTDGKHDLDILCRSAEPMLHPELRLKRG